MYVCRVYVIIFTKVMDLAVEHRPPCSLFCIQDWKRRKDIGYTVVTARQGLLRQQQLLAVAVARHFKIKIFNREELAKLKILSKTITDQVTNCL